MILPGDTDDGCDLFSIVDQVTVALPSTANGNAEGFNISKSNVKKTMVTNLPADVQVFNAIFSKTSRHTKIFYTIFFVINAKGFSI